MNDEERAEFEAMRAREAEMEAHFNEAEARVAQSQREVAEQQQATARMQQEWEVMKAEVSSLTVPSSVEDLGVTCRADMGRSRAVVPGGCAHAAQLDILRAKMSSCIVMEGHHPATCRSVHVIERRDTGTFMSYNHSNGCPLKGSLLGVRA